MSQAKVVSITRAQKHQGECEICGVELPAGSPYRWFSVGFRSKYKHKRCMKEECTPTRAARESSKMSSIYDAIDTAGLSSCKTMEDIESVLQEVAGVVREIAEEYRTAAVNQDTGVTFNMD